MSLDDFPVGAAVLFRLGRRSAPISCKVTAHVPAGEVETSPGTMASHPDLLTLQPDDGGYPITATLVQVEAIAA
jgi:hypothetical protein